MPRGEPGASFIDGEGGADAVFGVAHLNQHALIEGMRFRQRLALGRRRWLGDIGTADGRRWTYVGGFRGGTERVVAIARAAGEQRPDDDGQHNRIDHPIGDSHARLREPLIFVSCAQLTSPPP